jgi:NAD-dependent dihydropyrimidine dehydrogenase PreA subunit
MRKQSPPSVKRCIEAALFVAVLALGWRYPYLAYCLLVNVAVGLAGALRHGGRHGCGTFCPRGAFYSLLPDTGRKLPPGLLAKKTSLFAMAAMVTALAFWMRPATVRDWGRLFYAMIVFTTAVGLVGWLVFNRHFWCSVCPMGKIYKAIRPGRSGIRVDESSCVKCGLCAKACPFGFFPPGAARDGVFRDPDCLHCLRCAERCPKKALSFESRPPAPEETISR